MPKSPVRTTGHQTSPSAQSTSAYVARREPPGLTRPASRQTPEPTPEPRPEPPPPPDPPSRNAHALPFRETSETLRPSRFNANPRGAGGPAPCVCLSQTPWPLPLQPLHALRQILSLGANHPRPAFPRPPEKNRAMAFTLAAVVRSCPSRRRNLPPGGGRPQYAKGKDPPHRSLRLPHSPRTRPRRLYSVIPRSMKRASETVPKCKAKHLSVFQPLFLGKGLLTRSPSVDRRLLGRTVPALPKKNTREHLHPSGVVR